MSSVSPWVIKMWKISSRWRSTNQQGPVWFNLGVGGPQRTEKHRRQLRTVDEGPAGLSQRVKIWSDRRTVRKLHGSVWCGQELEWWILSWFTLFRLWTGTGKNCVGTQLWKEYDIIKNDFIGFSGKFNIKNDLISDLYWIMKLEFESIDSVSNKIMFSIWQMMWRTIDHIPFIKHLTVIYTSPIFILLHF